ncbi:TIGR03364 family FAD-dependent oxidoreductase [Flavobacterium hibernum]|uniref:Oxidase n=1 Tax=Flavobacterium hibernum TaxID=37752 RepID=A0A0D0EX84_9FLAO|nr:TIGR03364 family FAD-dependent oxidoreductase [Flavobacterium hibernum]KIO51791.1 oxidase [Flavobacterium hibernum]OXA91829.1 oxidase [Flavobacterium hibernum]STO19045.1 N-methyltryptophan oxidase [Flavobacterium hibernum]
MNIKYDLIVIGGGALGAFHAYHALEAGLKVAIIEKDKQPISATVRNFGQVVPSGMDTKWQNYGRESLKIYDDIQSRFDITVRKNGSVYLASNQEEVQLIEELSTINKHNAYESHLLTKEQCLEKYPGLKSDYVLGGLFFPDEVTVEPRVMINRLLEFLIKEKGLNYFGNTKVINCDAVSGETIVTTANGVVYKTSKVILCCGSEFKTLYPELFAKSDIEVTKLQMLQTKPQLSYELKGSILTGLSIRRYEAFYECSSFSEIKAKEEPNSFEKKWGIHILFKQATDGSVIIGDSHEYADAANMDDLGFDLRMDVDDFMIAEAKKIFNLPTFEIQNRWYGMYSQCKENDIFQHTVDNNIHIITGIGGKGMTGSAGFSKENIKNIFNLK